MECLITKIFDFERDGINVSDLCRVCGISRQAFYNVISNKSEPRISLAISIVDYLNDAMHAHGYESLNYDVRDLWK